MARSSTTQVVMAFERQTVRVAIGDLQPLRMVTPAMKLTAKYAKITASIREVGIIEPPAIARIADGKYLLLDGHLRVAVLQDMGETEALCLLSTDDEGFTYNKRVSRLAAVQEHKMILRAVARGVPDSRIARALNIDIKTLQEKKYLLTGICPEAIYILQDKQVTGNVFRVLKRMVPIRQIECAELMVAMNRYTVMYADSLLAGTPDDQLLDSTKPKSFKGLSPEQIMLMERESSNLEREFKLAEQSYGSDHLDLVLAKGYLEKLLSNARVVRYLGQNYNEILREFQRVADLSHSAA